MPEEGTSSVGSLEEFVGRMEAVLPRDPLVVVRSGDFVPLETLLSAPMSVLLRSRLQFLTPRGWAAHCEWADRVHRYDNAPEEEVRATATMAGIPRGDAGVVEGDGWEEEDAERIGALDAGCMMAVGLREAGNVGVLAFSFDKGPSWLPEVIGIGADKTAAFCAKVDALEEEKGWGAMVGGYLEDRVVYDGPLFAPPGEEPRCIHLGIDIFSHAGSPVFAPLPGTVHSIGMNDAPQDYGPTLILTHDLHDCEAKEGRGREGEEGGEGKGGGGDGGGGEEDGGGDSKGADGKPPTFYTLYGHMAVASLLRLKEGDVVEKGDLVGWVGGPQNNGGWAPHLHFQIMTNIGTAKGDFIGAAKRSEVPKFRRVCPNPNLLAKVLIFEQEQEGKGESGE